QCSTDLVITTDAASWPHSSVYVAVQVGVELQPSLLGPSVATAGVKAPSQLSIPVNSGATTVGLQPRSSLLAVVLITGSSVTCIHVDVVPACAPSSPHSPVQSAAWNTE